MRFYIDFHDFPSDPLPAASAAQYRDYMAGSMDFIRTRNARIDRYAIANLAADT